MYINYSKYRVRQKVCCCIAGYNFVSCGPT